ncbi:MAG: peptidase M22 [Oscillospiraceae bacterium]
MSLYLGIDTSNYTTSAAIYNSDNNTVVQKKLLLPVKDGERGLRQSDAVFHHTVQLPKIISELMNEIDGNISSVGVSVSPRSEIGSYMPCFLSGITVAKSISAINNIPYCEFSHQDGHIVSALFSSKKLEIIKNKFIAFHISGGTTEAVLVSPYNDLFSVKIIAKSLDLKAGQAIDRVGVMLGLKFPAGAELEKLSHKSNKNFNIKASVKSNDCSLSGIENKCKTMLQNNELPEDIARFCIQSVIIAIEAMLQGLIKEYGDLPILFSGGVTSNSDMNKYFSEKYNAYFAKPEFSADNAAGIAILTYLKLKE